MAIRARDLTLQLCLAGALVGVEILALGGRSGIDQDVLRVLERQERELDRQLALLPELEADIAARRARLPASDVDEASARLASVLVDEPAARSVIERVRAVCRAHAKRPLGPEAVREGERRSIGGGCCKIPVNVAIDLDWADVGPFLGEIQDHPTGVVAFEGLSFERGPFPLVSVKLQLATLATAGRKP